VAVLESVHLRIVVVDGEKLVAVQVEPVAQMTLVGDALLPYAKAGVHLITSAGSKLLQ